MTLFRRCPLRPRTVLPGQSQTLSWCPFGGLPCVLVDWWQLWRVREPGCTWTVSAMGASGRGHWLAGWEAPAEAQKLAGLSSGQSAHWCQQVRWGIPNWHIPTANISKAAWYHISTYWQCKYHIPSLCYIISFYVIMEIITIPF